MLTESQIEQCLAKIRVQLTMPKTSVMRPNIDNLIAILKTTIKEGYDGKLTDDNDSVFDIGLHEKTALLLENAGYETVRALRAAKATDLLAIRQFGPSMLDCVREMLLARGVRLRDDPPIVVLRSCFAKTEKLKDHPEVIKAKI